LTCALELERSRQGQVGRVAVCDRAMVGKAATPNRMGRRGIPVPGKTIRRIRRPCGFNGTTGIRRRSLSRNVPGAERSSPRILSALCQNVDQPRDLQVHCANHQCLFTGDRPLPIVAVDEPIIEDCRHF
jgi:hypothetical protein